MKIVFLACSVLLLCSCANPISTSSIDSSSRDTSEDSSISTPKVEENERLRSLWLRFSDNNGVLFQDEAPLFRFLGNAAFADDASGLITAGDQGIFQFFLTGENVQLGDFVQEGELINEWGLKVLANLGKGEFDETEPGWVYVDEYRGIQGSRERIPVRTGARQFVLRYVQWVHQVQYFP